MYCTTATGWLPNCSYIYHIIYHIISYTIFHVLNYCHRLATQLQLNISYIMPYIIYYISCTELLPPGGYPIAAKYIISYIISYHHHHHISVMELGHLLTRSGLTFPEVSSKVCHDSFCQLGNSVSLLWVIYYRAFFLHVVSSFSCIPLICLKLVLFLIPLQFVHLFCNQSKCILLFFSCISSLLLLFFWHPLL